MKKIFFIIFIFNSPIFQQEIDSLSIFNPNDYRQQLPNVPFVVNKILTGNHIFLIDSLKKIKSDNNEVFRIQIFESMVATIARAEAKRFQNILGDSVYIDFETPLYKLSIGNYSDRKSAEKAISSIRRLGARDSWIVRKKNDLKK